MIIFVDFDGVLHSYSSPFEEIDKIPDPPNEGAIEWLRTLINEGIKVTIYSTRNIHPEGEAGITDWLYKQGLEPVYIDQLSFTAVKHNADVYLDDKAITFQGAFPTLEELKEFKPWWKR